MSRGQHRHSSLYFESNDTESTDWSSITDSQFDALTKRSVLTNENFESRSADVALLVSSLESKITLHGRSNEISSLQEAFFSLKPTCNQQLTVQIQGCCRIVIVHGISGSGKTVLVEHSLRHLTTDAQGFFVSGKYEANAGIREPHAAILEAFSDLCDLTIQSADFNVRKKDIQYIMGRQSARILSQAISNLSPIWQNEIGTKCFLESSMEDQESLYLSEALNATAFAKFMVACKSFLKAMSSKEHPIVLFIDDIQWMDHGSKQLLSFLMNDHELTNIMIVLAYRDEEENAIAEFLQEVRSFPNVTDIGISNLDVDAVNNLISEIVGSKTSSTEELSNVVATKTRGNPFHIKQFLGIIQREGLMTYKNETSNWLFDVDEIQRRVMVSETLADLLAIRVKRLPKDVQECLKIAALLGYRFDEALVQKVATDIIDFNDVFIEGDESMSSKRELSLHSVAPSLNDAMKDGFIEKTKEGFQFSHDKLQMTFLSMIEENKKAYYHYVIGKTFLTRKNPESWYSAAVHLHQAPNYTSKNFSCDELANIDLEAAKYCKGMGAFNDAALFLHRGLDLLNPDRKWTTNFYLAFEMTEMLSKMELIIGNHESCKEKAREILSQAKTTKMKASALLIEVECCMTCNEMNSSVTAANRALRILGYHMPQKIFTRHVIAKLLKVKLMIRGKSDEYILGLPRMSDEAAATAVRLLLHLYSYCSFENEHLQAMYCALFATEITMKYGLTAYAPSAFTIYGVAELSSGNYRRGYRFGKLAITLLDEFTNKEAECATVGTALSVLTHWLDPIREMPPILLQAANRGLEIGDVTYGTLCLTICHGIQILLGENLHQLEHSIRSTYNRIRGLSQDALVMWAEPILQFVLNMKSQDVIEWQSQTILTGEIMNESHYIQQVIQANHQVLLLNVLMHKIQLTFYFGEWEKAIGICNDMMGLKQGFHFNFAALPCSFFAAMASYSMYRKNKKRKYRKAARQHQRILWQADSRKCPNSAIFSYFLKAEHLSIKKSASFHEVTSAYEFTIETIAAQNFPQFEALAFERAAFYQVKCKNRVAAQEYFDQALELYGNKWGAVAKHDFLAEVMEEELSRLPLEYPYQDTVIGNHMK
jgi:histidine kinase